MFTEIHTAAFTAVKGFSTATTEGEKKKGAHLDNAFEAGLRAGHTISPEGKDSADSLSTPEQHASLKGNVLAGFAQKGSGPVQGRGQDIVRRRQSAQALGHSANRVAHEGYPQGSSKPRHRCR